MGGYYQMTRFINKLETYDKSLDYLTKWCQENQKLSLKISEWLSIQTEFLDVKQLKIITDYHVEISKVMYATVALLDKIYRQKERLEKWQENLEKVQ